MMKEMNLNEMAIANGGDIGGDHCETYPRGYTFEDDPVNVIFDGVEFLAKHLWNRIFG